MSSANRSPQQLLADRGWRLRHSLWLLAPILGLGILTWAAFLYIGTRAHSRYWQVSGIGYAIIAAFLFIFIDSTEGPAGKPNEWVGGAIFALWLTGIVHAVLSNRSWLRWRSQNASPWYSSDTTVAPAASAPTAPLPPELARTGIDTNEYYAPQSSSGPRRAPGAPAPDARPTTPARVDINVAPADVLAELPGFDLNLAHRMVVERGARRGFAGIAEFADAAGLAPHQHHRLRDVATCSPPRRGPGPTASGRLLDY